MVLYKIHWVGLLSPSWERELDLQHSRHPTLLLWHPNTAPTEKKLPLPKIRPAGAVAITRPDLPRPRLRPCPPRPLAPHIRLHHTFARGAPFVQGSQRPEVAGQDRPSRFLEHPCGIAIGLLFGQSLQNSGSLTTLDRSRSISGRRAAQPPASPTTDRGVCHAIKKGNQARGILRKSDAPRGAPTAFPVPHGYLSVSRLFPDSPPSGESRYHEIPGTASDRCPTASNSPVCSRVLPACQHRSVRYLLGIPTSAIKQTMPVAAV